MNTVKWESTWPLTQPVTVIPTTIVTVCRKLFDLQNSSLSRHLVVGAFMVEPSHRSELHNYIIQTVHPQLLFNRKFHSYKNKLSHRTIVGTTWRSFLRHCATNRKVAGSITGFFIGIFHCQKTFQPHYGPGLESESEQKRVLGIFPGCKGGRCVWFITLPP